MKFVGEKLFAVSTGPFSGNTCPQFTVSSTCCWGGASHSQHHHHHHYYYDSKRETEKGDIGRQNEENIL